MEKQKTPLTERQRAERVVASQGKSLLLLASATAAELAAIAELADEAGRVQPHAPAAFREILIKFYQDRKAVDATLEE